ncbi:MAG: M20/M25/M40 family metallo-hydrolase [Sphaerochaetaceae bacterium]|nr:M20/M25/M40 family metallo-hydrolase [Sphaerochaetaceae bacterium]
MMRISEQRIVSIFKDMIRINTTNPPGNEKLMCSYIGKIFDEFGIEYTVIETGENRANIIAEKGPQNGKAPVVFISHLDVVSTEGQIWSHPPFAADEIDSVIYGRGTVDTKHLTAMELGAFINTDESSLDRPLYFVATADEEKGSEFGMKQIADRYEQQFKGAMVINEGGGFYIENKNRGYYLCTLGEKGRCDVKVAIDGDSGPSSFISEHKAVDIFTELIDRLSSYEFPKEENGVSDLFDRIMSDGTEEMFLSHFSHYNCHDAIILNTYDIGRQINVLPHHIEFSFALQLLPGKTIEDAKRILNDIIKDLDVTWEITDFLPGFISSTETAVYHSLSSLLPSYFGPFEILPVFALGRTDGRFLGQYGCDVYGFSPVSSTIGFKEILTLVHQTDERIDRDTIVRGTAMFTDVLQTLQGE